MDEEKKKIGLTMNSIPNSQLELLLTELAEAQTSQASLPMAEQDAWEAQVSGAHRAMTMAYATICLLFMALSHHRSWLRMGSHSLYLQVIPRRWWGGGVSRLISSPRKKARYSSA